MGQAAAGLPGTRLPASLTKSPPPTFPCVLNYSVFWGTEEELLAYAAYANSHNVKIMWTFNDPAFAEYADEPGKYLINDYSEIAATCGCSTNKEFLQYLVKLVKDLPATYGYSIGDEPVPNAASNVQNLYNLIRAVDSKHPQMVNATWNTATAPSLADLQKYLNRLASRTSSVQITTPSVPVRPPATLPRRPATSTPSRQPTGSRRRWRFKRSTGANTRLTVSALGRSAPIQRPSNSRSCCATPLPMPSRRSFSGTTTGTPSMPGSGVISSARSIRSGGVTDREIAEATPHVRVG